MPHILAPVPEADRCPKNQPDGGHMMKPSALEGDPRRCSYCGAAQSARDALEVMAFNLATGTGDVVEPKRFRTELDRMRAEVLTEVTAWLVKKAREFRASGTRESRAQADAVAVIASKISRGAVRPNNLRLLSDPGFFESGRTYQSSLHADLRFECLAISVDPATGETQAVGWRFGPPNGGVRKHRLAALDASDWSCCDWTDVTEDGAA